MSELVKDVKWIEWSIVSRPLRDQAVSGDLHVVEFFDSGVLLGVIDGVGHGEEAQAAAGIAARILKQHAGESVISLTRTCHDALVPTRGAVMTLASVDILEDTVTWIGVGNVEGRLVRADRGASYPCEHILLRGGFLGLQLPAVQATLMPITRGDLLVFATDGIRPGFEVGIPFSESCEKISQRIMSRYCKGTDDALVLVARYLGNEL
jgi:negative regulator of sigma-B (phosphoserine phosphatase)